MFPTNNENHVFEVIKRKENSNYEYEATPAFTFNGRPASQMERKKYRITVGINGNEESIFIYSSNLPQNLNIGDKIKYLNKEWKVNSIGYYFDASRIVNGRIFNEEELINKCPKGINIS